MNKTAQIAIVLILAAVVAIVMIAKQNKTRPDDSAINNNVAADTPIPNASKPTHTNDDPVVQTDKPLPRLMDLGADKCIPCKMMAPILEELKVSCKGQLDVVFIDVWKQPDEAKKYNIKLIPTQIFFDASGQEVFRHEGFFSKEDILSKWKEFGVALEPKAPHETP